MEVEGKFKKGRKDRWRNDKKEEDLSKEDDRRNKWMRRNKGDGEY